MKGESQMKKYAALILAMLMLLTTACQSGGTTAQSEASASSPQQKTEEQAEASKEEPTALAQSEEEQEKSAETEESSQEVSVYPLSDELVTLTYWGPDISSNNSALPTYQDITAYDFWSFVEEQTGVHLDMTIVSMMSEAEQLGLQLASGDYMDLMAINETQVSGGMTALLDQEIATDIAPIVQTDMPNYYSYISANEECMKLSYNDEGQMAGTRSWAEKYVPNQGLVIRQDLVDAMGLEMPTTIDGLHDTLTAMKTEYSLGAPMWLSSSGQNSLSIVGAMGSCGYAGDRGSTTDHLYVDDGQVISALTSDAYRDYLELMHQWYEEGLINSDFATNTDMDAPTGAMLSGDTVVINAMYGQALSIQNSLAADHPEAQLYALPTPVKNPGDTNSFVNTTPLSNTSWRVITTACEDPQLAARYIDWWYTRDGFLTANYGTRDLSYTLDADGTPKYADAVTNNSFGIDAASAVEAYVTTNPVFGLVAMDRTVYLADAQWVDDMIEIWTEQTSSENVLPSGVTLTAEETQQVTAALGDITTAASTETLKFIMGARDFDTWGDYCQNINAMGLEDVVAVYQDAYQRYLAR